MKKAMCTFFALLTCAVIALSAAGCNKKNYKPGGGGMTGNINIQVFGGGYGVEWLENIIRAYNTVNKDAEINYTETITPDSAINTVMSGTNPNDIVILNGNHFLAADKGQLTDLKEIYDYTPAGETEKISEKIPETVSAYFDQGGKYYHLPWASAVTSICYNKTAIAAKLGEDWSVPRTTEELFTLCDRLKPDVYPFVFSYEQDYMSTYLLSGWTAQYMGIEEYRQNFRGYWYDAVAKEYVFADTKEKSDNVLQNTGKLRALELFDRLVSKENGYAHEFCADMDFMEAQLAFCGHGFGDDRKPVAFTANGDWLESENAEMLSDKPQDIRMMKLPVISSVVERCDTIEGESDLVEVIDFVDGKTKTIDDKYSKQDIDRIREARGTYNSLAFSHTMVVPSASNNTDLAIDFLKYVCSDQAQLIFSQTLQGSTMAYGFDPSGQVTVSDFKQSVQDNFTGTNISPVSFVDYSSKLSLYGGYSLVKFGGIRDLYAGTKSASQMFEDMNLAYKNRWEDMLKIAGLAG